MSSPPKKISTRLIRKGALIEESYQAFSAWERSQSVAANLKRIFETNAVNARNEAWLKEIVTTLSNRFSAHGKVGPLVTAVQAGLSLEKWKGCLLWHVGRTDLFYFLFATEWLFPEHGRGRFAIRSDDVVPFVRDVFKNSGGKIKALSEYGTVRAARDLLLMAKDFGLVEGNSTRHFLPYHIADEAFLYVLHAIAEDESNARRIVESKDWRLFLMTPHDVEREILRLHQFQKLRYDTAGTLAQLTLPFPTLQKYADSLYA